VTEHALKTWPGFFDDVMSGKKNFEVRKNDRNYQEGDVLRLEEWMPENEGPGGAYTGRKFSLLVTSVLRGPILGIREGWCVMGVRAI
jgi:hypothetical protein